MDELYKKGSQILQMLRYQDLRHGGVLLIDDDEAHALVEQLIRSAVEAGKLEGMQMSNARGLISYTKAQAAASKPANPPPNPAAAAK